MNSAACSRTSSGAPTRSARSTMWSSPASSSRARRSKRRPLVPTEPRTLFDKVWDRHVVVAESAEAPAVLYVDLHLVHEVTSPQAFAELAARGLKVRRPDRTFATLDHSTPTLPAAPGGARPYVTTEAEAQ